LSSRAISSVSGGWWAGAAAGGRGRRRRPATLGFRVRVRVWEPPWPPNLEGGSGVATGPATVVGCGRNGGRR
jgi:hypothetical protein